MILVERIDGYGVLSSPRAEGAVDTPGIRVGDVEEYCISQHVSRCHDDALLIELGVEQVCIDQVGIQRELFLVLPVTLDLPIVFLL